MNTFIGMVTSSHDDVVVVSFVRARVYVLIMKSMVAMFAAAVGLAPVDPDSKPRTAFGTDPPGWYPDEPQPVTRRDPVSTVIELGERPDDVISGSIAFVLGA